MNLANGARETELTLPLVGAQSLGLAATLAILGRSAEDSGAELGAVSALRLSGGELREFQEAERTFVEDLVRAVDPSARFQWSSRLLVWVAPAAVETLQSQFHPNLVHVRADHT